MRYSFVFLAFSLIWWINTTNLIAQNISDEPFIAQSDASGEETLRELQIILGDSYKSGERLFIIARAGKAEKFNRISFFRLARTRFLVIDVLQFPMKPIFAEGERVEGEGRIEFYLGSRLRLVALAKRNQMPNLDCCPDYIPPVKTSTRKKRPKNR